MTPSSVPPDDLDSAAELTHQTSNGWWSALWNYSQKQVVEKPSSNQAEASNPPIEPMPEPQNDLVRVPSLARPIAHPPRQQTYQRRIEEKRENLLLKQDHDRDLRARMKNRRRTMSEAPNVQSRKDIAAVIQGITGVTGSVPDMRVLHHDARRKGVGLLRVDKRLDQARDDGPDDHTDQDRDPNGSVPPSNASDNIPPDDLESASDVFHDQAFWEELSRKFNLCLSMQFRDGSDREKFFVTYIEKPNLWRKVTISCDYRDARENTLEAILRDLHYQRDKIARIYEAIRDSLGDIQFYDTVTNLKLETTNNRLHVHVAEDGNEITEFPLLSAIDHLHFERHKNIIVRENSVYFESHLSGFVYKVNVHGKSYIKKEISTPDTVEEFLYEINALAALRRSTGVIDLIGVVIDETATFIKGLLIEFAAGGSVADFFDSHRNEEIPWNRKEKWARQVVSGLADIHEAGFVQGDCTISNIVFDSRDNVKIVDINRRGCPIGWEPPEFEGLIRDKQKVSIYIGAKSDLFQLGMILWAIAKQIDEPEREDRPLILNDANLPAYFRDVVHTCLAENPVDRASAKQLLELFPIIETATVPSTGRAPSPLSANDLEDMKEHERVHSRRPWIRASADIMPPSPPMTYEPEEIDQENVLAGMDPFHEAGLSASQEGFNSDGFFRAPTHHDSGLDISDIIDAGTTDEDDPLAGIHQAHRLQEQQQQHLEFLQSSSNAPFEDANQQIFKQPMHSDSGFNEATFGELHYPSMPTTAGLSSHEQADLPAQSGLVPRWHDDELFRSHIDSSFVVEPSDQNTTSEAFEDHPKLNASPPP